MNKKTVLTAGVCLALGMGLTACSGSRKTAQTATGKDCNYATAGAAMLAFAAEQRDAVSGNDLPKDYTVLKASNEKAFFAAVQKEGGTAAIQLPSGCRKFRLSLSETMNPQLAERYPELVSLKGIGDNGADLRLGWDGTTMRGQVIEAGKSFLLEPRPSGSGNLYILFNKDDVTTPRRAFEEAAPMPNRATPNDRGVEK